MSFSSQLLIAAVVVAAIAVIVAQRFDPLPSIAALARALAVIVWLTLCALVVHAVTRDLNLFGVAHVVYLAVVVSIPLAAAALFVIGVHRLRGTSRQLARRNVLLLLLAMVPGLLGIYATHIEPNRLAVDRQTIALEDVDQPFRIAVLADLQTPNIGAHERRAFDEVVAAEADLVVIPGDLWSGGEAGYSAVADELADLVGQLTAIDHHVVMVAGDTDSPAQLRELAAATGATFLDDEIWRHDFDGRVVTVVGTALPRNNAASFIDEQLQLDLARIERSELAILLSHRPDAALGLGEEAPIDLVIAGHTHGGQIAFPLIGPMVTLTEVPRAAARGGAVVLDGRALYVSSGVGLERGQAPQVRFGVTPEIGVLELTPA